ncbi:MAG: saccharopine dehydrogenase family protein [Dethiobacteria bacterium]|jgi:lysine 6-dehydrogenase
MKIVVLGGAGDMGAAAVRDLLKFTDVQQVTIAARNTAAAEKLASALGDRRAVVQKVEATSHADLVRVMQGHDVAAGALGPFYRFEKPLVEAALTAGVDYVSICDDHDAVQAVLALDRAAAKKERKILTGLGWTPGITNILARKGYDELDNVEKIQVYWAGSAGDSEGLAVILHTLHIFTGKVVSFQDGEFIEVQAGSGKEIVAFPAPLGKITVFHLGHPEPVTLPRYLPGVQEITLKGGLAENYLHSLAKTIVALGFTSTASKKQKLGTFMKKMLPLFPAAKNRSLSGARVDITGMRNGQKVRITYATVDRMRRLTGIPLSIGACMLAQGKIKRCGVFGPEAEGAINPDDFLQELARRDIEIKRWETGL